MSPQGDEQNNPDGRGLVTFSEIPDWVQSIQYAVTLADGTVVGPVTVLNRDSILPPSEAEPDRRAE